MTETPANPRKVALASLAMRAVFATFGGSWRFEVVGGPTALEPLRTGATLVAFWHHQLPASGLFIKRNLLGARPTSTLVSHSRDGEIGARTLAAWGVNAVRGSSSRGGRGALVGLRRALLAGHLVAFTPDGPRGPARKAKVGIVTLAQSSGVAVVPMGSWPSRAWTLRSWDKMQVPKPFARIRIVFGDPLVVATTDDLGEAGRNLDQALDRAIEQACP